MSADTAAISEYRFRAIPVGGGKIERGKARAISEVALTSDLRGRGMIPLEITSMDAGLNRSIHIGFGKPRAKMKSVVVMCRQLATMLESGTTLVVSLDRVAQQTEDKVLQDTMRIVRRDVNSGQKFSDALDKHDHIFPPLMTSMVRAGETGGFLEASVGEVATTLENDHDLRSEVKGAMVYPAVVTAFALLAAYGMIAFIVPIFANIYTDLSEGTAKLPLLTQVLVAASKVAPWAGIGFLIVVGPAIAYYRSVQNQPSVRAKVDTFRLKVPIFGPLMHKSSLARFAGNFSQLLGSGVPLPRALDVVKGTVGNYHVEQALGRAADAVRQRGATLSSQLERESLFPPMLVGMIATGEDSGKTGDMISKAGVYYRKEVERTVKTLKSLLEPILIAVLGSVVGVIVIGIYLPYINLTSVIQQ